MSLGPKGSLGDDVKARIRRGDALGGLTVISDAIVGSVSKLNLRMPTGFGLPSLLQGPNARHIEIRKAIQKITDAYLLSSKNPSC